MADAVAVHNQGGALIEQYQRTGDHRLLDEGVSVLRDALRLGGLTETISTLASSLLHRYETAHDPADLDEAMDLLTRLVDGPGVNLTQATEIVRIQRHRYERDGDLSSLNEAIALAQGVVGQTGPGQRDYDLMQHLLGLALAERYDRTRHLTDLEGAIAAHRIAADNARDELRPGMLLNLAATLRARIAATGDLSMLEEAEAMVGGALAALPKTDPERGNAEWLIGALAQFRAQLNRDTDVLTDGIGALRRSVESARDPESLGTRLDSLAGALLQRFEQAGEPGALDEAIEVLRRTPPTAEHLTSLGNALRLRYRHLGDVDSLREAVRVLRDAVAAAVDPHAHTAAATSLTRASTEMAERFPELVTDAVNAARALVAATPSADANEMLAVALRMRFDVTDAREALIEAGELFEQVLRQRPAKDPLHPRALANLGGFWQQIYELTGTPETLNEAVIYYGRAARADPQQASYQHCFARLLLRQAEQAGDSGRLRAAARALAEAAASEALDPVTRVLAAHTASVTSAGINDWEQALRGAERAMALLLRLRRADVENGLAELTGLVADAAACAVQAGQLALAAQWLEYGRDLLLARVFEDDRQVAFPSVGDLQQSAVDGPVVLVNVSRLRCDALTLWPGRVELLPLPRLRYDDAVAHAEHFGSDDRAFAETLEWLWDTVTEPVLEGVPEHTHVWWSPTGPLAGLPLHAAGRDGRTVLDRVVSSYTPTVRALTWARARAAAPVGAPSMVVVAPADAPYEVAVLAELWEAAALEGPLATRENVLAALEHHPYVHFACSGSPDDNPARSGLRLHDGPLTALDVARLGLPAARLAVLSCGHLAGAFLLAGYPSVVDTLWEVGEQAAADVSVAFHSALLDHGLSLPARALHAVVCELRDRYPARIWAAFTHTGA
ncbi:CHAT domain-containing protein [Lentzea chajnantorensis]